MKNELTAILLALSAALGVWADTWTDPNTSYTWAYANYGYGVRIEADDWENAAISPLPVGALAIPDMLGGKKVTRIGAYAFRDCSGLTSVRIPDSVMSIEGCAFNGCNDAIFDTTTIQGLKLVDGWVLGYTDALPGDLRLTAAVRGIGEYAFAEYDEWGNVEGGTARITNVTIAGGVKVGDYAFSWCRGITNMTLLAGVTNIGGYCVFEGCKNLRSITIPASVASFGAGAFLYCDNLRAVHVTDIAAWCKVSFGGQFEQDPTANPLYHAHNLYLDGGLVEELVIPEGVGSVGDWAFGYCTSLKSVKIPESVTNIGEYAFAGCSGLTNVTIPSGVTSIGNGAFSDCSGLASVTIPDSVTDISTSAFDGCGKLWTNWYKTLANISGTDGGLPSVVTTIIQQVAAPYSLTNIVADRAIASVTVDSDCAIDEFVLKDGKVYDCVLYISNTSEEDVTLTLPVGNVYKAFKGARPLTIPANSQHILTITRVAETTFLVSREELETLQ